MIKHHGQKQLGIGKGLFLLQAILLSLRKGKARTGGAGAKEKHHLTGLITMASMAVFIYNSGPPVQSCHHPQWAGFFHQSLLKKMPGRIDIMEEFAQ